ncbi:MAG: catalase family protein [Aquabacterium sp.]
MSHLAKRGLQRAAYLSLTLASLAISQMVCQTAFAATAPAPNAEGEVIPGDEPQAIASVTESIRTSVQAGFDKNGHAFRDAHRKAHGCVQAKFTVLPGLPAKVAQGLFATPKAYSAVVRFSNGSGASNDDHSPDGRGMAIKVMGVPGMKIIDDEPTASTQDFVMINHPVFFVRNAKDYVGFQKALSGGGLSTAGWLAGHIFHEGAILLALGSKKVINPLNSRYWSMVPYKLGTEQMKYSAKPCAGGTFYEASDTADRLGENLRGQLATGGACFDFMVQTRMPDMPIEDPTIEWKESKSPFVPVARVEIPAQTPESEEMCEVRSFTPWHSITEHRPLGGISRVRKTVYQTISKLRHDLNGQPRVEP